MKTKTVIVVAVMVVLSALALLPTILQAGAGTAKGGYVGIDESIMEARAEEAGRPARAPFINTDQGDILLFVFCVGGLVAGGLMGYLGRMLFVEARVEGRAEQGAGDGRQPAVT
jgi:cobalt/nickel transport system permease protein